MTYQYKNEVHLAGVLAKDPAIRYTANGKEVANLTLVTKVKEFSEFHRVVAWESLAQKVEGLHKGDFLQIVGRLQTRSWEDASKIKRYSTEVIAFQLVVPTQKQEPAPGGGTAMAKAILSPGSGTKNIHGLEVNDDDISF